jgi:hypothetical protein
MGGLVEMGVSFPLFVVEKDSGDVMRFDSLAEIQKHLERTDVENEEYLAWESSGRPIRMTVQEPAWLKLESKADLPDRAGLFQALQQFAGLRGIDLRASDYSTAPLVLYEKIIAQNPRAGFLGKLFKSRRE